MTSTTTRFSLNSSLQDRNSHVLSKQDCHRSIFSKYWSQSTSSSQGSDYYTPKKNVVKFHPRVCVLEFPSADEPEPELDAAAEQICGAESNRKMGRAELISILTEKCLAKPQLYRFVKLSSFTSPAIRVTPDDNIVIAGSPEFHSIVETHMGKVLIIESNKTYVQLYVQYMKIMFPTVAVFAACSQGEAFDALQKHSSSQQDFFFDLIIVNHRLSNDARERECKSNSSGSEIIHYVQHQLDIKMEQQPMLIGTSKNLREDSFELATSGADILWGFPPPPLGTELRNNILAAVLDKRAGGQSNVVIV